MVERKANLEELSGNLTANSGKRIRKEFARAPKNKILLIEEATYPMLVEGKYDTEFNPKAYWAMLLSMWHEYGIPVMFMPNKKYSGQFIYGYLYYYIRNLLK